MQLYRKWIIMRTVQSFRYTGVHSLKSNERTAKYWAFHGDQSKVKKIV